MDKKNSFIGGIETFDELDEGGNPVGKDMGNLFFTSDLHFNSRKFLDYRRDVRWNDTRGQSQIGPNKHLSPISLFRDVLSVQEMNQVIMDSWNQVVGDRDTVIVVGDFYHQVDGWGSTTLDMLMYGLNGKKVLVIGNHDRNGVGHHSGWLDRVPDLMLKQKDLVEYGNVQRKVPGPGMNLYVHHYPSMCRGFMTREDERNFYLNVHGHVHGNYGPVWSIHNFLMFDVCFDTHLAPVGIDDIWRMSVEYARRNMAVA